MDKKCYLCTVFFIVLDLRLTKGWSTAVLLFFIFHVAALLICHSHGIKFYRLDDIICPDMLTLRNLFG